MFDDIFTFTTCNDILSTLSRLLKKRRLEKGYTRAFLQSITGVPAPTIARFESSSKISLESFVKLSMALGYQEELINLFKENKYTTMEEMETIKIKYFTDKIEKLTYIDGKSDWIDLRAALDVKLSKGELDFTNNQEAMEALAKDATANNTYFGGQNTYAIYAKSVLNADLSKAGKYDQFITENFQNCFLPFIQGAETGSEATECWAEFVKAVSKATGVATDKITYSSNVSLTADIAIGGSLSA